MDGVPNKTPEKLRIPYDQSHCFLCDESTKQTKRSHVTLGKVSGSATKQKFTERLDKQLAFGGIENLHSVIFCIGCQRHLVRVEKGSTEKQEFLRKFRETRSKYGIKRMVSSPGEAKTVRSKKKRLPFGDTIGDLQPAELSESEDEFFQDSRKRLEECSVQMSGRDYSDIIAQLWQIPEAHAQIRSKFVNEVKTECEAMCSTNNPSILRCSKPSELVQLTTHKIAEELKDRAPTLHSVLSTATTLPRTRIKSSVAKTGPSMIGALGGFIMKFRNQKMAAWSHKLGVVLHHEGLSEKGLNTLNKLGVCTSARAIQEKNTELCEGFDSPVVTWRRNIELFHQKSNLLSKVSDYLSATDDCSELMNHISADYDGSLTENVMAELRRTMAGPIDIPPRKALELMMHYHLSRRPPSFQLIGDNLDIYINTKHEGKGRHARDLHMFHTYAIQEEVSGNHLDDTPPVRAIDQIQNSSLLPGLDDHQKLRRDMVVLWSRVIVKRMAAFEGLRKCVAWHIPHPYSEIMKEKSHTCPLGIIHKSENSTEEIVQIMKELQNNYVPRIGAEKVLANGPVLFGGDQLTEERVRNAQLAVKDDNTHWDRCKGLDPKNEDWHGIRCAYEAVLKVLRREASSGDPGTFWANANVAGCKKAKSDIKTSFNEIKQFMVTHVDAHIVSATMQHLGMATPADDVVPSNILDSPLCVQRRWLHTKIGAMVDKYAMCEVQSTFETFKEGLRKRASRDHKCEECGQVYAFPIGLARHLRKVHDITEPTQPSPSPPEEDHIFNHGCVTVSLGLLLRNMDDAVHEGDGERIVMGWRFMTLVWKKHGHTKYALAGLLLQLRLKALLSPRRAHQLIWNRTINDKGGAGKRKSLDLKLEQLNLSAKEDFRAAGLQNLTEAYITKLGQGVRYKELIGSSMHSDTEVRIPTGRHSNAKSNQDFLRMFDQVHTRATVFSDTPGREYTAFPHCSRNVLEGLDVSNVHKWINKHKKKWC